MDWGKVTYVFFSLMSLTSIAGFLYNDSTALLFIAVGVNLISTVLKIGVKNLLSTEIFASSLVADLHLVPAIYYVAVLNDIKTAVALSIGALIANLVSLVFVFIQVAKEEQKEDFE
jgi:phosphoglycerol transferase MdoB-like AlkP superfamily enzyme